MTGRVDQVDEEAVSVFTLLDKLHVVFSELVVHGDGPEQQRGQENLITTTASFKFN